MDKDEREIMERAIPLEWRWLAPLLVMLAIIGALLMVLFVGGVDLG